MNVCVSMCVGIDRYEYVGVCLSVLRSYISVACCSLSYVADDALPHTIFVAYRYVIGTL